MSPQSLLSSNPWLDIILGQTGLVSKQLVVHVAIDKADCIPKDGRNFRPEFQGLADNLIAKLELLLQPGKASYLAMSATLTIPLQSRLEDMLKTKFHKTLWGQMDRRNIDIEVFIAGKIACVFKKIAPAYSYPGSGASILYYTNSRMRAEGGALITANKVLGRDGAMFRSYTGDTGMKEKKQRILPVHPLLAFDTRTALWIGCYELTSSQPPYGSCNQQGHLSEQYSCLFARLFQYGSKCRIQLSYNQLLISLRIRSSST